MSVKNRGFASLSQEERKKISAMGGAAAHAKGVGHKFSPEEASAAGKKGSQSRWGKKESHGN